MPTPMKATLTVADMGDVVVSESSHPSFELAWGQAQRDLSWRYEAVEELPEGNTFEKPFEDAWQALRGALWGTTGQFKVEREGSALFTYSITEYEPLA